MPTCPADRRRADDRARRDDPGADPDADPPAAGRNAHGRDVHHARHGRRRGGRRPRRRHVRRRKGRGRCRGTHLQITGAFLYACAARRSAEARGASWRRCAAQISDAGDGGPGTACRNGDVDHRAIGTRAPVPAPDRVVDRAIPTGRRDADGCAPRWRAAVAGARLDDALRRQVGIFRPRAPARACGRTSELRPRGRRDARAGRRIGLRQVDDRSFAAAPGRHRGRQRRVRRPRHRRSCRTMRCSRCAATSR